jgi:hypothetical protein
MNLDADLIRRLARDRMKQRTERGLYVLGLCHALQAREEPQCVALAFHGSSHDDGDLRAEACCASFLDFGPNYYGRQS